MDVNTFPYRLDTRTRGVLAGIMGVLIGSGAKLQSASMPMTILFSKKEDGVPMDAQVYMGRDGINLIYRMNNVAKASPQTLDWLKKYNTFIQRSLKAPAVPAADRCTVMVEATYEGQMKYYFSYMMRYEDDSLAQDMPQGRLYAVEPLVISSGMQGQEPDAKPVEQTNTPDAAVWL